MVEHGTVGDGDVSGVCSGSKLSRTADTQGAGIDRRVAAERVVSRESQDAAAALDQCAGSGDRTGDGLRRRAVVVECAVVNEGSGKAAGTDCSCAFDLQRAAVNQHDVNCSIGGVGEGQGASPALGNLNAHPI